MDTENIKKLSEDRGVALVEFYASWCPHCKRMMPVVEDVRELLGSRATVYQFDIDENSELATELEVNSVPTFIVYKAGEEVWRGSGEMDGSVLVSHVEDAL